MIDLLSNEVVLSALIQFPFLMFFALMVFVAFRAMREDFNQMREDMKQCQEQQSALLNKLVDAEIDRG